MLQKGAPTGPDLYIHARFFNVKHTHSYMQTNRNILLNSDAHASYLLSDVVIDNNVSDLVQQLCQ